MISYNFIDNSYKSLHEEQKIDDRKIDKWWEKYYQRANQYPVRARKIDLDIGAGNGTGKNAR